MMSHFDLFHPEGGSSFRNSSRYGMMNVNATAALGASPDGSGGMISNAGGSGGTNVGVGDNGDSSSPCHDIHCYPDAVFLTATAVTVVLAICGAVGNILTVLAIISSRLRNNINSILICNLSFADAVYCAVVLPLQAKAFYDKAWTMDHILCELHAALRIWLIGVNILLLSFIALYRFLHVVRPQQHTRFSQGAWFIGAVIICWALPMFFSFTPLVGWWGTFAFQSRILQCTFSGDSSRSHKITTVTLGYVVPCLFLCVCYARIGCVVFRSRKRATRGGSVYRKQRARRDSFRLTGMMVLIFLGFLVGTTPFFLINTLDSKLRYPMPHIWSPVLAWVMYGLNPIIYTVMDAQFQQAYRRLLLCTFYKPEPVVETSFQERQSSLLAAKTENINAT
ncbi:G-protein coupled receptor moody [Aplysia californica]|uniref:G-protein coupled receptor moody n=1 Tax=Aplysia californica TaxID=6500 RepID=A0ABM0JPT6_APLCA|nr:G-protein coupled receptor moody [Aplysia californica]